MVANAAFDAWPTHHQMDEVCFIAAFEANLSFEGAIVLELDTSIALGFVKSLPEQANLTASSSAVPGKPVTCRVRRIRTGRPISWLWRPFGFRHTAGA